MDLYNLKLYQGAVQILARACKATIGVRNCGGGYEMTNEERIARFMNIVDTAFSMSDEDRAAYLDSLPQNTKNCGSLDGSEYVQLLEGLCLSLKERVRQEAREVQARSGQQLPLQSQ